MRWCRRRNEIGERTRRSELVALLGRLVLCPLRLLERRLLSRGRRPDLELDGRGNIGLVVEEGSREVGLSVVAAEEVAEAAQRDGFDVFALYGSSVSGSTLKCRPREEGRVECPDVGERPPGRASSRVNSREQMESADSSPPFEKVV